MITTRSFKVDTYEVQITLVGIFMSAKYLILLFIHTLNYVVSKYICVLWFIMYGYYIFIFDSYTYYMTDMFLP